MTTGHADQEEKDEEEEEKNKQDKEEQYYKEILHASRIPTSPFRSPDNES